MKYLTLIGTLAASVVLVGCDRPGEFDDYDEGTTLQRTNALPGNPSPNTTPNNMGQDLDPNVTPVPRQPQDQPQQQQNQVPNELQPLPQQQQQLPPQQQQQPEQTPGEIRPGIEPGAPRPQNPQP